MASARYNKRQPPKRKLTVFKTYTRRGRGLRTDEDLPQDIFVGEIKGVVRDMRDSDGDWSSSHFRMALSNGRELDATHVNSQARYVNHTCGEPNCGWEEWEGADGKVHVAVFTVMPVKADTELTIRYHDCTQAGMEEPKAPPQQSKKGEACLCGSDNCCGLLWGPELEGP
ncbi:SET domain-containing protein [Cryphonectria parasitica EP155]|uniref:SET domain-containing protein n=1 Tax=Cryphonectria parasitica (strain ATCC 38755 / EP155) TaxID=660469 RepID=A0A9P4Y7M5_CRYP1|nr:SET domain-containing protein [Cryphonectria parasitica EP155]KAF3768223.1 SET domain-containing protein [Cryphonectria parasitica EP155]